MTERIKETLYLEYYAPSAYANEDGEWRQIDTFLSDEDEAKRQARQYAEIYKKVRLLKHTLIRTTSQEEVDFSE